MKSTRLITVLCAFFSFVAQAAERKPNFIFIIADDHRRDAMGTVQKEHGENARFPWFETPSLDRFAAGGVRFRNAYITHSICSRGGACFLVGQYTLVNGVMDNNNEQTFSTVVGFKSPHINRGALNLPDRLRNLYEGKTTRRTPTWLDITSLPAHLGMHGTRFKNLALGKKPADWRKSFLS